MKKLFSFCAMVAAYTSSFATVHTACNTPANLAEFNTIQAAIDASSSGDTIYVIGSPTIYDGFTIAHKKLAVFGIGWSPDKQLPLTSKVNGCTLKSGSAGSELHGLSFFNNISIDTLGINDVKFIRNRFSGMGISIVPPGIGEIRGYLFEGNWFENASVSSGGTITLINFIFHNNIFYGSNGNPIAVGFVNTVNVLLDHNLWYSSNNTNCFGNDCRFLTISNSIFVKLNAALNNSGSTFNNNITFQTGNDAPWSVNGNTDGGGNVAGQDPGMADQARVNSGEDNPLLDFTIASGVANNSGSDGKDMGLLFDATGSLNWNNNRQSRLPLVVKMLVTTPEVLPGGNVTVSVEARKND